MYCMGMTSQESGLILYSKMFTMLTEIGRNNGKSFSIKCVNRLSAKFDLRLRVLQLYKFWKISSKIIIAIP